MSDYLLVQPNGSIEDEIIIGTDIYKIRFKPKHAEHIWDNYPDPLHRIKHREILSLVKKSIVVDLNTQKGVLLGKFKNRIYETWVLTEGNLINVVTSYKSNKRKYIQLYEGYENERKA